MSKEFHNRSLHNEDYNFDELVGVLPDLSEYISSNQYGNLSLDFSDPHAVQQLNKALLKKYYDVLDWSIPHGQLCPAVPGRADYIHHIADLLALRNGGEIPVGTKVKALDIGTGTSCIYPILGNAIYGWKFVATDINSDSINHAKSNLSTKKLKKNVKLRFQSESSSIFKNIIKSDEKFDFVMCNPPFYSSQEEAESMGQRKIKNLNANKESKGHKKIKNVKRSESAFGGRNAELWCSGGELSFITKMIRESVSYKDQCSLFTTLVSNKENLGPLSKELEKLSLSYESIKMTHGKKITHILTWTIKNPSCP
jgi:23S rRNA (adenine1618-N6)-methyltransferase